MNVNDRRKNGVPGQASTLKKQPFVIIYVPSFQSSRVMVRGKLTFPPTLLKPKLTSYRDLKKKIQTIFTHKIWAELGKHLGCQCSIWQTRLGGDLWPWPALCFCCHLVLIKPPHMDMDPAVLRDSLFPFVTSSAVLEEPQFLSWPETHVRIYSNLYWSFQKILLDQSFPPKGFKVGKTQIEWLIWILSMSNSRFNYMYN